MLWMPMVIMTIEDADDYEFIRDLFIRNEKSMFWTAMKIVKDDHTAKDMVSSACERMIKKIAYLRRVELCKQTSYINSIVKNTSLMYLRKRRTENIWLVGKEEVFDRATHMHHDVDEDLIVEAEAEELRAALGRIHKRDKELLMMKYFEDLPDEEIAAQMGIGKDSVRCYLTKARRSLKEVLEGSE